MSYTVTKQPNLTEQIYRRKFQVVFLTKYLYNSSRATNEGNKLMAYDDEQKSNLIGSTTYT